jgi:8-oxo-dGTP diphosphatase
VLDASWRVLLIHFDLGTHEDLPNGLWACPGGGIKPHETPAEGLRRELREELGLEVDHVGQPIWRKEHVFPMSNGWDGQHDIFYLVEVDVFEPRPALSAAELLSENVDDIRWWTLAELRVAQATYDADPKGPTTLTFSPRRLAHLISDLLATGRPPEPLVLPPL